MRSRSSRPPLPPIKPISLRDLFLEKTCPAKDASLYPQCHAPCALQMGSMSLRHISTSPRSLTNLQHRTHTPYLRARIRDPHPSIQVDRLSYMYYTNAVILHYLSARNLFWRLLSHHRARPPETARRARKYSVHHSFAHVCVACHRTRSPVCGAPRSASSRQPCT